MQKLLAIFIVGITLIALLASCGTQTACSTSGSKNYKNTIVN